MDKIVNYIFIICLLFFISRCTANDILGCGGFVKSHANLDFSKIEIGLYTKEGSLKEKTECAPTNGYYFLPLYEKGEYILKVHPPPGWSFEPSKVNIVVDGNTDQCSTGQDINFVFNGFGITGRVITAGQSDGPSGISVQLVNEKGNTRHTMTTVGGDFHFTPVIPGKYTVKASHPRWKLQPSQAAVRVQEGNTALPAGALAVSGYDVRGSVTLVDSESPLPGLYVLLYSKEENPKFRVEGCQTALLQGVPDSPICYSVTDSSGEFTFGLVPAGEYRLLALAKPPGRSVVTFNVKPLHVQFTVLHDSLYIKKAFEVTGLTVVGVVETHGSGTGIRGARVSVAGQPVATTDSTGRYTLSNMQPGTYTLSFNHEQCKFDDIQLVISTSGLVSLAPARPSRWRVCGTVRTGPGADPVRRVRVAHERDRHAQPAVVGQGPDDTWCTYLPPGVYTAEVEVSEQERRDGLQYYPLTQRILVSHAPVDGVGFSQLKAELSGSVVCSDPALCHGLPVTLRSLSPEGVYIGPPVVTHTREGRYTFAEVLPGSVEISVPGDRLCWAEGRRNVAVTAAAALVPPFEHVGYALIVRVTHPARVEYECERERGEWDLEAGASRLCVGHAARYTLRPRGCHLFQPDAARVDTAGEGPREVTLTAVAHALPVRVMSPRRVEDLVLTLAGPGARDVGPVPLVPHPDGGYVYEHTLYTEEGSVWSVSARSGSLLFPRVRAVGAGSCARDPVVLRGRPALTVAGRLDPPVAGVTVELVVGDEAVSSLVTGENGRYSFGPLDASERYTVRAEKESYAFTGPDPDGVLLAHKLAEIRVELVDEADGSPLGGALVSVSGGSYRRNLASGPEGRLLFPSLAPAEYYVKPLMKEYRFAPPHRILSVVAGRSHRVTLGGTRVAWSGVGTLTSVGGQGLAGVAVLAAPEAGVCASEEATTDGDGGFRIRGLVPDCTYRLRLKDPAADPSALKLVSGPSTIQVREGRVVEDIRLIAIRPHLVTDGTVLVRAPDADHYRTLRLRLALEETPTSPLFTVRLDHTGYSRTLNPGLMYPLPRLPVDNETYVLTLESTLSKSTHLYSDRTVYFTSDGQYKRFTLDFVPEVKSSEQELRQTSLLVVPLLGLLVLAYLKRHSLMVHLGTLAGELMVRTVRTTGSRGDQLLDKASIDQIVNTVNAAGKKTNKKKTQ